MVVGQSHDKSRKEVVLSIAHCGPIAEIVSRNLLSLFVGNSKSKSSKAQNVRVASVRSFGDDVASVDAFLEEEEEECEDENETLRLAVVVVETVENDDIAREGMALVKRLCRAAKEEDQEEEIRPRWSGGLERARRSTVFPLEPKFGRRMQRRREMRGQTARKEREVGTSGETSRTRLREGLRKETRTVGGNEKKRPFLLERRRR